MKKVTIYAVKELREPIFERLRDLGIMQVTEESSQDMRQSHAESYSPDISQILSKLDYLKSYLFKYNPVKKSFIDMFTGKKPEFPLRELERLTREYDIERSYEQAKKHEERLKEISAETLEVTGKATELRPWADLDVPLAKLRASETCESILAVLSNAAMPSFDVDVEGKPLFYEISWEEKAKVGVFVVAHLDMDESLSSLIASNGGQTVRFEGVYPEDATVSMILDGLDEKSRQLSREAEDIVGKDQAMSQNLLGIMALYDYYLDKKHIFEVGQNVGATGFTLVIDGYVKDKDLDRLKDGFEEFRELEVTWEDADEDDPNVPVFLENHPIIAPFEIITNIFGYPKYNEIDPTPFLAPFFWIFFGICLGDAIYGIALTLGSWWFIKSQGLKAGGDKFMRLLMYSGIGTVVAGAATSSWMSDLSSVFFPGSVVDRFVQKSSLINPIEDPLSMMMVSFGFGILQIWVGIGVKMASYFKRGEYSEGIWTSGSWLVFIPGLVLWVISQAGVLKGQIWLYIMALGALMVIYNGARNQKNIFLKPISGLGGLYGIVSYFSDMLSYSRLLALGLSSAIIGVVINKIAILVSDMIPYVGWVFVPVILIGGHTFNLVINALSSFIHSGRLQFVEFFTKFFEGGGRPFKPLTRISENVSIGSGH